MEFYLSLTGCTAPNPQTAGLPPLNRSEGAADTDCGDDLFIKGASPVVLANGIKTEQSIDLSVPYSGGVYNISREYSSTTAYDGFFTMLGERWVLSPFQLLDVEPNGANPPTLLVGGPPADRTVAYAWDVATQSWKSGGPTAQLIRKTSLMAADGLEYPVYRLQEPGSWSKYFLRAREAGETHLVDVDSWKEGLLFEERDTYGNFRQYVYADFIGTGSTASRLMTVFINGTSADALDPAAAEAWLSLSWLSDVMDTDIWGRLGSIRVYRHDSVGDPVVTQYVEYFYKPLPAQDWMHVNVGSAGDLAQVIHYTRTNDLTAGREFWPSVTQYRYYDWCNLRNTTDERLMTQGAQHQLKMVFGPEQIEYLAQQRAAGSANPPLIDEAVIETAAWMLQSDDNELAYIDSMSQEVRLVDAASKIIGYEVEDFDGDCIPENDPPVIVQFIQSACGGCGGTTAQGIKKTFEYGDYTYPGGHPEYPNLPGVSTRVREYLATGSGGQYATSPYRTMYYDHVVFSGSTPYRVTEATEEEDGSGRIWVTHYSFDADGNRTETFTPSCYDTGDYGPHGFGGGAPTLEATTSDGLVYVYGYTADNRRNSMSVNTTSQGSAGATVLLNDSTYSLTNTPTAEDGDYRYLVESARLHTGITVEETTFTYGQGDALRPHAVFWSQISSDQETVAQNGLGAGTYNKFELFDDQGRKYWERAADLALIYRKFDQSTGQVVQVTANANPAAPNGDAGAAIPSGGNYPDTSLWGRYADGGELASSYTVDLLGRTTKSVSPGGVEHYILREMAENEERPGILYWSTIALPHSLGGGEFDAPAVRAWVNASGDAIRASQFEIDTGATYDPDNLVYTLLEDGELSRTATDHTLSGLTSAQRNYYDVDDPSGTAYYTTAFEYDALGRVLEITDANGTVLRNSQYDVLDRVLEIRVGTEANLLVPVKRNFYDHTGTPSSPAQGIGNGNVTVVHELPDADPASLRITELQYDERDRLEVTVPPEGPFEAIVYDEQDRITEHGIFSTAPDDPTDPIKSSNRTRYTRTFRGERGLVYRIAEAIDPSDTVSTDPDSLETHFWYDSVGRVLEKWAPTSSPVKYSHDGLSRVTSSFLTDRTGDVAPGVAGSHGHADDVDGDTVIEQTNFTYDERTGAENWSGRLILTESLYRNHDYTGGSEPVGTLVPSTAVATYTAHYYDAADRLTHTLDFGVNRDPTTEDDVFQTNIVPTWPPSPQAPPDRDATPYVNTARIAETTFNVRGLTDLDIDPEGHKTKSFYDDLDRVIATAENYVDATIPGQTYPTTGIWDVEGVGGVADDEDRVTSFVYNPIHNVTKRSLHVTSTEADAQTTTYSFGVTTAAMPDPSDLNSNSLLYSVTYPDSEGASDIVTYGYNRLGEVISTTDQNTTHHDYTRDLLGRITVDDATPGTGIDTQIVTLETEYDGSGRIIRITSKDGSPTPVVMNEVVGTYTPQWQVDRIYQDNDGVVEKDAGGEPLNNTKRVDYDYDTQPLATGNHTRLGSMDYPTAGVAAPLNPTLSYLYGSAASANDVISRLEEIRFDPAGPSDLVGYEFVGLSMQAVVDFAAPDVQLDRTFSHDGKRRAAGHTGQDIGTYPGWDRFGRVAQQVWVDGRLEEWDPVSPDPDPNTTVPYVPPILEETYSYDRDSNRLTRTDARPGTKVGDRDFRFTYDNLDRLTQSERGRQSTSAFWTAAGGEAWDLEPAGNWDRYGVDADNDGDFFGTGEVEDRVHNEANEIKSVTFPGGSPELPVHDAAGNIEDLPRPTGGNDSYTYDSWNRLVKVEYTDGSAVTLGVYAYDARHRRISALTDTNLNGTLDESREYYYADSWRIIEEHIDGFDSAQTPDGVVDRITQQLYGIRGLNDAIARRIDDDPAVLDGYEKDFYLLCDVLGSCVALIDETARLYERVVYEPYGKGRHRWAGDVNFDGVVNMVDVNLSITDPEGTPPDIGNGTYIVDKDLDRLGTNNSLDLVEIFQWMSVGATPLGDGLISSRSGPSNQPVGPDCRVGYTGHTFMPEGLIYDMRNRDYSPRSGRFLQRDPIEYADSMNLYAYVRSGPVSWVDVFGLRITSDLPGMEYKYNYNPGSDYFDAFEAGYGRGQWFEHPTRRYQDDMWREGQRIEAEQQFKEWLGQFSKGTACTEILSRDVTDNAKSAAIVMAYLKQQGEKASRSEMNRFYTLAATEVGLTVGPGLLLKGPQLIARGVRAAGGARDGYRHYRTTRILNGHVTDAVKYVDALGDGAFTPRQFAAVNNNANLRPAFRGNRIDVRARSAIENDRRLAHLKSNYTRGPDFVDSASGRWYDMTTKGQWAPHTKRYGPGGTRLPTDGP